MADLHELFVDEFDAAETRRLEQLDLRLDEQVKRDLGHKQARPRPGRVADRGPDVGRGQVLSRVDRLERVAKHVVEDVVDAGAAAQFLGRDLERGAVDRGDKVAHKLRHELQDQGAAVLLAEEGAVAERVQFLLRLAHERVQARLHVGQLIADVVHQDLGTEVDQHMSMRSRSNPSRPHTHT